MAVSMSREIFSTEAPLPWTGRRQAFPIDCDEFDRVLTGLRRVHVRVSLVRLMLPTADAARRVAASVRHPSVVAAAGADGGLSALYVGPRGTRGMKNDLAATDVVAEVLLRAMSAACVEVPIATKAFAVQHRWSDELFGFRPWLSEIAAAA